MATVGRAAQPTVNGPCAVTQTMNTDIWIEGVVREPVHAMLRETQLHRRVCPDSFAEQESLRVPETSHTSSMTGRDADGVVRPRAEVAAVDDASFTFGIWGRLSLCLKRDANGILRGLLGGRVATGVGRGGRLRDDGRTQTADGVAHTGLLSQRPELVSRILWDAAGAPADAGPAEHLVVVGAVVIVAVVIERVARRERVTMP